MRLPLIVELNSTAVIREELAWHIEDLSTEQAATLRGGVREQPDNLAGLLTNGTWGPFSFICNLVVPMETKAQLFQALTGIDLSHGMHIDLPRGGLAPNSLPPLYRGP